MKKSIYIKKYSLDAIQKAVDLINSAGVEINGLYAADLMKLESEAPELFKEVRSLIADGKWYPFAGFMFKNDEGISCEGLNRNILYSSDYLYKITGRKLRTAFCESGISTFLAQGLYSGRFDAAVMPDFSSLAWLDGADDKRILLIGSDCLCEIDEYENDENEYVTFEKLMQSLFESPLEIPTLRTSVSSSYCRDTEKPLLEAEKILTSNAVNKQSEIKALWLRALAGEDVASSAQALTGGLEMKDTIKIDSEGVRLRVLKFAEDNSGAAVIRIHEREGSEKTICIMSSSPQAGFRVQIMPHESRTFRINTDGWVREPFTQE